MQLLSVTVQRGNAEMYRRSGLVISRKQRLLYDADNNNGQLRRKQVQAAVQKCRPNKAKPIAIHVKDTILPRDGCAVSPRCAAGLSAVAARAAVDRR